MTEGILIELRGDLSVWEALESVPHIKDDMQRTLTKLDELIDSVPAKTPTNMNALTYLRVDAKRDGRLAAILDNAVQEINHEASRNN